MLIGHYAIGFVAKRFLPKSQLITLLYASTFLDLIWAVTFLAGVERPHIDAKGFSFLQFTYDYPISHGFTISILCALIFAGCYWLKNRNIAKATILGLVVFSHWILDLLSYSQGLPLYLDNPLLTSSEPVVTKIIIIIEVLLLGLGVWLYTKITQSIDFIGKYGWWGYIILLTLTYLALDFNLFQVNENILYGLAVGMLLLPICATWLDDHRRVKETEFTHEIKWTDKLNAIAAWLHKPKPQQSEAAHSAISADSLEDTPTQITVGLKSSRRALSLTMRDIINKFTVWLKSFEKSAVQTKKPKPSKPLALTRQGTKLKFIYFLGLVPLVACVASYFLTAYLLEKLRANDQEQVRYTYASYEFSENAHVKQLEQAIEEKNLINQVIQKKPQELIPALYKYAEASPDIALMLKEQWEEKLHIGGAMAVSVMNWQKNHGQWKFSSIEEMGFRKITDDNALVNQVLKGNIKIEGIQIEAITSNTFNISIKLINLTGKPITCLIPEGQVYELKDEEISHYLKDKIYSADRKLIQHPFQPREEPVKIPPSGTTKTIMGYCMNPGYKAIGGKGNLAIYSMDKNHLKVLMSRFEEVKIS
jgi:hypothetical protein